MFVLWSIMCQSACPYSAFPMCSMLYTEYFPLKWLFRQFSHIRFDSVMHQRSYVVQIVTLLHTHVMLGCINQIWLDLYMCVCCVGFPTAESRCLNIAIAQRSGPALKQPGINHYLHKCVCKTQMYTHIFTHMATCILNMQLQDANRHSL